VAALAALELGVRVVAFSLLGAGPGGAAWRRRAADSAACLAATRRLRQERA
jgi:hypothetical protein